MEGGFTLRVARPDDLARLDALYARSYPKLLKADYPPSVLVMALPLISIAQPRLLASGTYYVCETRDGDAIGAGGWTPAGQGAADVRHVVTDDRFTRRGVARAILARCITEAHARGLSRLLCKSTFTAVPFYRSLGFVDEGRIDVPLAPGIAFPAVHMYRALP